MCRKITTNKSCNFEPLSLDHGFGLPVASSEGRDGLKKNRSCRRKISKIAHLYVNPLRGSGIGVYPPKSASQMADARLLPKLWQRCGEPVAKQWQAVAKLWQSCGDAVTVAVHMKGLAGSDDVTVLWGVAACGPASQARY